MEDMKSEGLELRKTGTHLLINMRFHTLNGQLYAVLLAHVHVGRRRQVSQVMTLLNHSLSKTLPAAAAAIDSKLSVAHVNSTRFICACGRGSGWLHGLCELVCVQRNLEEFNSMVFSPAASVMREFAVNTHGPWRTCAHTHITSHAFEITFLGAEFIFPLFCSRSPSRLHSGAESVFKK